MGNLPYIFLIAFHFAEGLGYPHSTLQECPLDCICYSDYLHNLESWKWVEPDVHADQYDPEHIRFNPYTEHNEVFENPNLERRRKQESILTTVTCMIRNNHSGFISNLFGSIPRQTQVLSLIQAPGSGSVHFGRDEFKIFHSLVGLEIKGYNNQNDITKLTGDSFVDLSSLTYLNLETVILEQLSVENSLHDPTTRVLRINYTFNDIETNEVTSQLLIFTPDMDGHNDSVLPYYEYKKVVEKEKHQVPLIPKFRVGFTGLPKLQHLRISGCNLQDISWDMFYKLENLKYLLLDENDLLFLPDFVFYATSNLSALSLSNNKILNLQTVGLAGLFYLQKLDVTRNNITHLSELSLPPFPHLEVADFRHNPISSIFPNTFEIMNSTKTLYLGSQTTSLDLSPNSFYGLVSLTKLDIVNVKIRLLEKSMLKGMPKLTTLIMTGEIPRISFDGFGEVTNLEKLILRNCGIKKISMDAFFGLTALTELDMSYNSLTFLPPGIFEEQVSLREILLQHNKLTTLPVSLIDDLPVKMLRIEANPWHCSCEMKNWDHQLINRVRRYHIPTPNTTICQKNSDKGSRCFETYRPKFEVTYSYENRVSPVCETPLKFNKRGVFQVLRKELRYCKNVRKNGETLNTNSTIGHNLTGNQEGTSFPDNYSVNTLKALENQLLAKPVKPQKPKKNRQQPQVSNTGLDFVNTQKIKTVISQTSEQIVLNTYNNSHLPAQSANTTTDNTITVQRQNILPPLQPSNHSIVIDTSVRTPTQDQNMGNIIPLTTTIEESIWLPTNTVKSKQKDKKKNKLRTQSYNNNYLSASTNNSRLDRLPQISSKSLKLNKPRTYG